MKHCICNSVNLLLLKEDFILHLMRTAKAKKENFMYGVKKKSNNILEDDAAIFSDYFGITQQRKLGTW